mmetsp:Transcript_14894/g.33937  ORF Transcript_14894/g.33937 Transcript_14894/m.33937 type:complete len:292 (+) Transcript_14894:744-1619(+)
MISLTASVFEPAVHQDLLGSTSLGNVLLQHRLHKLLCLAGHDSPIGVLEHIAAGDDLRQHLVLSAASKRWVTTQENIQRDSTAPDVTFIAVLSLQHLRCNIIAGEHPLGELLAWRAPARDPKVAYLDEIVVDRAILQQEKVLWLEISVAYRLLVEVAHAAHDLLHDCSCMAFCPFLVGFGEPLEDIAPNAKLHDDVHCQHILVHIVNTHYIRVLQRSHQINLLHDALLSLPAASVDNLYSHCPLAHSAAFALPCCLLNLAIGAFSYPLPQLVMVCYSTVARGTSAAAAFCK